jgi:Ser/Thr protein kinase RdoA (MazF antagonist)
VLSFAPGACPYPEDAAGLLASDAGLRRAARLVREFHDAVSGFVPPVDARWNRLYPAEQTGDEIIAHQDLAPWNLVVDPGSDPDAGAGWMFIDWDGAAPGTRLWDVAYAIKGFAPLWHGWNGKLELGEEARRIRLFADAYGLDEPERRELVPLLGQRALAMHTLLRDGAARAEQPWARLWEEGHGTHWREAAEHLTNHQEHRLHALLA